MTDPLLPAVMAMSGGVREPIGWFRYDVVEDSWTWSSGLFRIHGFEPGEITPTSAIFASHKHPEDRPHTDEVLAAVLATGEPYCCRHRIVDAQRRVRTVVTIGQGTLDDAGRVIEVHGYFVDITGAQRDAVDAEVSAAINESALHRAAIEQAKGALMLVHGITADDAFAILRWHSQHANLKLRVLAERIVQTISTPEPVGETPTRRIGRVLGSVVEGYEDHWRQLTA